MPRPSIRVNGRSRPIRFPVASGGGGGGGTFAASHVLGTGKLTMGQTIPSGQVPSGQSLAFTGLSTQFDLKTTWPDGSARFAILSANVASGATYPLAVGSAASGSFSPTIPTASVVLHTATAFPWALLGDVSIASGTGSVVLGNATSDPANTNYLIADAVLFVKDSNGTQTTIRNGDSGYSKTGGWTNTSGGYSPNYDYVLNAHGSATATATWTATGLATGTYKVYARWVPDPNRTSVAPFTVKDGSTTVATATVDQASAPNSFTPTGVDYTATLPGTVSSDLWLSGPSVKEWRRVVIPVTGGSTPHLSLSVIFDVRVYADGTGRMDITVENTYDVSGATAQPYSVDVTLNGSNVFTHAALNHYYLTRWRKTFPIGSYSAASVTPDFGPMAASKALPGYLSTVSNPTYDTSGTRFDILQLGGLTYNGMAATGGRPELGPYPDWVAQYLVHKGATQLDWMLKSGDLYGSQPVHVRESDGSLISIDARPQFWLDAGDIGFTDAPRGDLSAAATGPFSPDAAHQPSVPYAPYLLTGDRYYADEMKFWANYDMLVNHPTYVRNGSQGLLANPQVRGIAWPMRDLSDTVAYLPDADPDKAYFLAKLNNNLQWADAYVAGSVTTGSWTHTPASLGTSMEQTSGLPSLQGYLIVLQWQCNYLAFALSRAHGHGFSGGTTLRDRIVAFANKKLNSDPSMPPAYGCQFFDVVGTYPYGVDNNQDWTYYTTMAQVHAANLANGATPDTTTYGIDARLSLLSAIRLGLSGAQSAYDYLMAGFSSPGAIQDGFAVSDT